MSRSVDRRAFWERKILAWETGRYERLGSGGCLEIAANWASRSLRFRLECALACVAPFVAGRRVVELGCGSGLLAGRFLAMGAASYRGVDIADAAVRAARRRWDDPRIAFERRAVAELAPLAGDADLVFSLGLLDWLDDADLAHLFARQRGVDFLHAIAERRPGLQQWIHRLYVEVAYGHRTGHRPRYYGVDEIAALAGLAAGGVHVHRDRRLSFGALVSNLPIPPGPGA